mgnify:CR=1 FL=1
MLLPRLNQNGFKLNASWQKNAEGLNSGNIEISKSQRDGRGSNEIGELSITSKGIYVGNGRTARLLGPKEIDYFQQIISSNSWISVLCLLLFIVSLIPIFTVNKLLTVITAIFFILIILPLIKIGYSVTIPFLIFGSFILIISLFIDIIFERARKLNNSV